MMDKNDLLAISELLDTKLEKQKEELRAEIAASEERMIAAMDSKIAASEKRTAAAIAESQVRMEALVTSKIATSNQLMEQRIRAAEVRINVATLNAVQRAAKDTAAMVGNVVQAHMDAIKKGLDFSLERPRVQPERVERIEQDVEALKFAVRNQAERIEELQRSA